MQRDVDMNKVLEKTQEVRRELHNHPEHSGHEEKTKKIIRDFLKENTHLNVVDYHGGILAVYESGNTDSAVAFRADFDAVSLPDGAAAHLCGHDGHTAALLGVALMLEQVKPDKNGILIFQPGEETGEGAKNMTPVLEEYGISEIYGCHNLPGFEFGRVFTSRDTFACASCGMIFEITGTPAHAAYPESGNSPIGAVTDLFHAILDSQGDSFEEGTFATLIGCTMGQKAFGTSAEKAEVWVTVRSRSEKEFRRIRDYLESVVKNRCESDHLSYTVIFQDEFPATVNDRACAEKVLEKCDGELLKEPMRWSEDFGHFLNSHDSCKGAFFGIGAGNCADLHTKDYEYPDELLEYQINAFLKLLR